MASQRTTFGKRQREQNRKDKTAAKRQRLAARRASPSGQEGPEIAWDEAVHADAGTSDAPSDVSLNPTDDAPTDDDSP